MTVTDSDVQAWLERQADHWAEHGRFTSDVLPGIGEHGIRAQISDAYLRDGLYERFEPVAFEFYCMWLGGLEFTTTRQPVRG